MTHPINSGPQGLSHISQLRSGQQFSSACKTLYLGSVQLGKSVATGVKGLAEQVKHRQQKRDEGASQLKTAIARDQKFPGLGDRLMRSFRMVTASSHVASSHTKTTDSHERSASLESFESLTPRSNPELSGKRDAALNDVNESGLSPALSQEEVNADKALQFFDRHFDVLSSPEFWAHRNAKLSGDSFGALLSLSVLARIQTRGEIRQQDLTDLSRGMRDFEGAQAAALPESLAGPLTDDNLKTLTQHVFDHFIADDALCPVNLSNSVQPEKDDFEDAEGEQRVKLLHDIISTSIGEMSLSVNNITEPLKAIV